ncbi:Apyrase [Eumeta japonica]|uniref:Apyrase n=1 Tax=Eumeta variegata TaxID=151549 RepID=A0A4C1TL34_EUMVA|nr:Apyrase [Eumeta japonica]
MFKPYASRLKVHSPTFPYFAITSTTTIVLGNHEFDNGIEGAVPYMEHLDSHVVTANINDDLEPTMHGLYEPSVVIERNGRRIGIIGVIISTTDQLASTGRLVFTDEVESVRSEAEKLNAQGVDIIVVLSHCGLDIDHEIALHGGPYIDIVVGGHSHSLLYTGEPPDTSAFTPVGPYPVVVAQQGGRSVLIVQAAAHTQYLGEIKLFFDNAGNLMDWDGHPHYLGNDIVQAPDVLELINKYLPEIEELANEEVGSSLVHLSSGCACSECNLGSFICEAFLNSPKASYTPNTKCSRGFVRAESCLSHKVFIAAQPLPPSPVHSTSKPSPPPLLLSLPSCSSLKPHLVLLLWLRNFSGKKVLMTFF